MAVTITKLKIAEGHGKVYGDAAAIDGLLSFEVFRVWYEYFRPEQPSRVVPCRALKLLYQPPGATGILQDTPAFLDFYGKASQKRYTVWIEHLVAGVSKKVAYNMVTLGCTLKVAGADFEQYEVELGLDQEELVKMNNAEVEPV